MRNKSLYSVSAKQLKRAAVLRGKIETLERQLARILGDSDDEGIEPKWPKARSSVRRSKVKRGKKKRTHRWSASARAKLAATMRARWAKIRARKRAMQ